jgi:hypothetical protein
VFPHLRSRMVNKDLSVPITFVAFDLLTIDGTDLSDRSYEERRDVLVSLGLDAPGWATQRRSRTDKGCGAPCASRDSKGLLRRSSQVPTGLASAAGSRRRIRTTGVVTQRSRRCSGRGNGGRGIAHSFSSYRRSRFFVRERAAANPRP